MKFYLEVGDKPAKPRVRAVTKVQREDRISAGVWHEKDGGEKVANSSTGVFMGADSVGEWGFLIVWEFRPKPGAEKRFEEAYGPQGIWARLFSRGEGYVGTKLNQDLKDRSRYITLDLWRSEADHERFRKAHAEEYEAIDRECEELTEMEREIGRFGRVAG